VWFQSIVTSLLLSQCSTVCTLRMCVKFVLILPLGSGLSLVHQALRQICEPAETAEQ